MAIFVFSGLVWGQYRFYLNHPDGDEFLSHWVGARAFLIDNINPNSEIVKVRIQAYAVENNVKLLNNTPGLVDPIYVELLYIPFGLFENYLIARALWMLVLEFALVTAVWLSLRVLDWQPNLFILVTFLAFSIAWYPAVRAVGNGSQSIIAATLMIAALAAIRSGHDELAGIMLALSTIQPQMVGMLILLVVIWTIIRRRKQLLVWLVSSWIFLILLGILILPTRQINYANEILSYLRNRPPAAIQVALSQWLPSIGHIVGQLSVAAVASALVWSCWIARKQHFRVLIWTACMTITLTLWIIESRDPSMLVNLVVAFALIFFMWSSRWKYFGPWWSIFSMFLLTSGSWMLFLSNQDMGEQLTLMYLLMPGFLLVALIWVRWWYVHFPDLR